MADPSPGSDLDPSDTGGRGGPPATPRWVKVMGIVVVVLAVLVVVMLLLGHGPGQHSGAGATTERLAPAARLPGLGASG